MMDFIIFWQMDACRILAFREQIATATLMDLGPVVRALQVILEMEHSVRTLMR